MNDAAVAKLAAVRNRLSADCFDELDRQHIADENRHIDVSVGLRVAGSDAILDVPDGSAASMTRAFATAYQERFGTEPATLDLTIATIRVAASGAETRFEEAPIARGSAPVPVGTSSMWDGDRRQDVPIFLRDSLAAGSTIGGPAILVESSGTTVVDRGWCADVGATGELLIERSGSAVRSRADTSDGRPDPVRLEVFNRLFMHIAEQMGVVLRNTAVSVNIRERLDFSCALFDAAGRLVSNAPHMPVHLGSMGESVRSVITATAGRLADGDAVMLNSPYNGGTHLPDVTVVTPWFGNSSTPQFFLASRAHHADIGGMSPGSMPATSRHIEEEGVLIDNVYLVRNGKFRVDAVRELLLDARFPARNPEQNIADLKAQLAANRQGIRELEKAIGRYGIAQVQRYLTHVRHNAATSVKRLIGTLRDGRFSYPMDSGDCISVRVTVQHDAGRATIDFTGTSPQSKTNFNAPEAVTRAAVLYVFRSLIDDDIPLNEGCLEPLEIVIPRGCLLSPLFPAAVVAGNVETSQCVTDAIYGALGALAASQGTMNNLSFGNDNFQYYETIAGGAGAGPGWHGADAVQTHMTNSRLTDAEVLESTYPVRLETFSVRSESGGKGEFEGGNGAIRELRFLAPVDAALLTNHRRIAPFGLAGGADGMTGRNTVIRADGSSESLGPTAQLSLNAGDRLRIETPGGGGYGAPRVKQSSN